MRFTSILQLRSRSLRKRPWHLVQKLRKILTVVSMICLCPPVMRSMPKTPETCCKSCVLAVNRTCSLLQPLSWCSPMVGHTNSWAFMSFLRASAKHQINFLTFRPKPIPAECALIDLLSISESTFWNCAFEGDEPNSFRLLDRKEKRDIR